MAPISLLHYPIIFTFFFSQRVVASIPDFETSRLKSTGGAGAASLLMNEATILNPAPLAFFRHGSVALERTTGSHNDFALTVSDSKGRVNGSFSYIKQTYRNRKRTRWALAMAYPVSKQSSMGMTYRQTKEPLAGRTYRQTVFGLLHALSRSASVGVVVFDPLKGRPEEARAVAGFQYVYKDFLSIMLDLGVNYYQQFDESLFVKTAMQTKAFGDVYLRAGFFHDKKKEEKGSGIGLGWVQPRLVLDLALKTTQSLNSRKTFKQTGFGLSYKF